MINISIDQALMVIASLKLQKDMIGMSINDDMSIDRQKKKLEISNKVSMLIKDLEYKLSNEILNS